jgi:hypothetical protein
MAAAVQRIAIEAERHRFTLRQTRRTVPITFSIILVQASEKPWPLDLHLAAVKTDLALRVPPAVRPSVTTPRMAWTADACAS